MHKIDVADVGLVGRVNLGKQKTSDKIVRSHDSEFIGSSKPAPPVFGIRKNNGRHPATTNNGAGFAALKNINVVLSAPKL